MNRIFSGVQPTGNLHLGNYLGAIKNWLPLSAQYDCHYMLVDLHAITVPQAPRELEANTREVTAAFIAAGFEPALGSVRPKQPMSSPLRSPGIHRCFCSSEP